MQRELVAQAPAAFGGSMRSERRGTSSRRPIALLGLGLTLSLAAAGALTSLSEPGTEAGSVPIAAPLTSPGQIVLNGEGDITVLAVTYDPGQSSGWHAHAGVHAVAVLAGELTVYDRDCVPQRYRPGTPYIGGRQLHLVRNETDQPVALAVTYLNPAGPAGDAGQLAPPPNCTAA